MWAYLSFKKYLWALKWNRSLKYIIIRRDRYGSAYNKFYHIFFDRNAIL